VAEAGYVAPPHISGVARINRSSCQPEGDDRRRIATRNRYAFGREEGAHTGLHEPETHIASYPNGGSGVFCQPTRLFWERCDLPVHVNKGRGTMANVTGFDPAPSGQQPVDEFGNQVPVGVWGDSDTDVGVFGTSGVLPPNDNLVIARGLKAGVIGHGGAFAEVDGEQRGYAGVIGHSLEACGVCAFSKRSIGLYAFTENVDEDPRLPAIFGSPGNVGIGVHGTTARGEGVVGDSWFGTGVRGTTGEGTGVLGEGHAGNFSDGTPIGVNGVSDKGIGVRGESLAQTGVEGFTTGTGYGVYGLHFSNDSGSGVYGVSVLGSGVEGYSYSKDPDSAAVRGQNAHGNAGLFIGNVKVTGSITKGGGGFHIDHPKDPQNKSLSHSFVESPEMMNVYSGTVTTDERGNARVALPDYFEALNREFRYQLTTIGQFARVMVSEEIRGNEFAIQSEPPRVKVCWQVTGVRQDAWAEANRIPVEQDKPDAERGRYLHPELFGHKAAVEPSSRRPIDAVAAVLPDPLRRQANEVLSGSPEPSDFHGLITETRDWFAQRARREPSRHAEEATNGNAAVEHLRPAML
jgi:hypothetical protein